MKDEIGMMCSKNMKLFLEVLLGRNHLCDIRNVMTVFFLLQKWGWSESVDPTDSYSPIISVPVDTVVCGND